MSRLRRGHLSERAGFDTIAVRARALVAGARITIITIIMHQQEQQSETMPDASPAPQGGMSTTMKIGIGIIIIAVLAFAAWSLGLFSAADSGQGVPQQEEKSGPVATVNGETISRGDFNARLEQARADYQTQGIAVDDPSISGQIEQQLVQDMVNELVLKQHADDAGIRATEEDITGRYDQLAEQYGGADAFEATLASGGVSQEQVRGDIARQLEVEQYLGQEIDEDSVSVTEEEMHAAYDEAAQTITDLPAYEDVSDAIKQQLGQQKVQVLISDLLDTLRQQSSIDILL